MRKLLKNNLLLIFNNIHNNKYDYSLVEYVNIKTKIKIICPTHGIFENILKINNIYIVKKQMIKKYIEFNESNKSNNISLFYQNIKYLDVDTKNKLISIIDKKPTILYHGTNRDFEKFDFNFERNFRTEQFLGEGGIYLTPDYNVAYKYANSNINNSLPLSIIDKALKINPIVGSFMRSLYYDGNITWSKPEFKEFLLNDNIVDPNDIAELVNLIPDSQSEKDYMKDSDENNYFDFSLFDIHTSALNDYHIEYLKQLKLGDYSPKIYEVELKPSNSILISNDISKIKTSKCDIIIAYNVPNLIDDIPEIKVKNVKLLEIKNIAH